MSEGSATSTIEIRFEGILSAARMMDLDDGGRELFGVAKSLIACELNAVAEELLDSFILWHAANADAAT